MESKSIRVRLLGILDLSADKQAILRNDDRTQSIALGGFTSWPNALGSRVQATGTLVFDANDMPRFDVDALTII